MSLPLFGDDEAFLETGTYPLLHGDEDLVVAATVVYTAKRLPAELAAALDGKAVRIVSGKCFEQTISHKTNLCYVVGATRPASRQRPALAGNTAFEAITEGDLVKWRLHAKQRGGYGGFQGVFFGRNGWPVCRNPSKGF